MTPQYELTKIIKFVEMKVKIMVGAEMRIIAMK